MGVRKPAGESGPAGSAACSGSDLQVRSFTERCRVPDRILQAKKRGTITSLHGRIQKINEVASARERPHFFACLDAQGYVPSSGLMVVIVIVRMMMVMTAAAMAMAGRLHGAHSALAVAQLLDDRRIYAQGTLHLQGGMTDVEALEEKLLYTSHLLRLFPPVLRLHVQMG